jgi:hypothetical protein
MFGSFEVVKDHKTFKLIIVRFERVFVDANYLGCCLGADQQISDLKKLCRDSRPDDLTSPLSSSQYLLTN